MNGSERVVFRMPHAFLVKTGALKPAPARPYVRPWADDDSDDDVDARRHGDDVATSNNVTAQTRQPFNVVSFNFNTLPSASTPTGLYPCCLFFIFIYHSPLHGSNNRRNNKNRKNFSLSFRPIKK